MDEEAGEFAVKFMLEGETLKTFTSSWDTAKVVVMLSELLWKETFAVLCAPVLLLAVNVTYSLAYPEELSTDNQDGKAEEMLHEPDPPTYTEEETGLVAEKLIEEGET
jgi:hypothetical protein